MIRHVAHEITFHASGRGKAQCPSNPAFPKGIDVIAVKPGQRSCLVALPYPAPECGQHLVLCSDCNMSVMITAAGRADDPRTARIPCGIRRSDRMN